MDSFSRVEAARHAVEDQVFFVRLGWRPRVTRVLHLNPAVCI